MQHFIEVSGKQIETDKHGYLLNSSDWFEEVAEHIAGLEGITLGDEHWFIVHFVRDFYEQYDTSPAMRALVKALQQTHGDEKGNSRYLYRLFPKGPAKIPAKLAGLPKPAKCL